MKSFSIVAICTVVFAAALLCVKPHSSLAQQSSPNEWRPIRVHNVRIDIMAYFIDPKHQKQPIEFKIATMYDPSHASQEQEEMDAMKSGAPELAFDEVLATDTRNTLWILSSQETFDQTKNFVDFMDKPLIQCELEVQVVKVNNEDLKTLASQPIRPQPKNGSADSSYKFSVLNNFNVLTKDHQWAGLQPLLIQLIAQGKAKILNSPHLTTLNHLTGSLSSATTTPVFLGVKGENNSYDPLVVDANNDYPIGIAKQLRVAFTPDINEAANTMTINLDVSADEGISRYKAYPDATSSYYNQTIWVHNQLDPPLVAKLNLADNQIIEITGLDTTMLGFDDKHDNVALFLTARIIHPAQ